MLALIAQATTLPRVAPGSASGLRALGSSLRSGVLLLGLFAILLVVEGHFTGFTYIRPAVESASGIGAAGLAALLLVYGLANILGTAVSGVVVDRACTARKCVSMGHR